MWLIQVEGRVVVDAASYFDNNSDQRPSLDALGTKSVAPQIEVEDRGHVTDRGGGWCGTGRMRAAEHSRRIQERLKEDGQLLPPTSEKKETGE